MMAARRLKFKPKPLVPTVSIRRKQDQDLPDSTQDEPSFVKETLGTECKTENLNLSTGICHIQNDNVKTKLTVTSLSNVCEVSNVMLHLPLPDATLDCSHNSDLGKKPQPSVRSCASPINVEPKQQSTVDSNDSSLIINDSIDNNISPSNSQNSSSCSTFDSDKRILKSSEIIKTKDDYINSSDALANSCAADISGKESDTIIEDISSNVHVKDPQCNRSSGKTSSNKLLSRFGRSRCKPVLNITGLRNKNEVKENIDSSCNLDNLRVESVIKNVNLEISKINSVSKDSDNNDLSEIHEQVTSSSSIKDNISSDETINTGVENSQSVIVSTINNFLQSSAVKKYCLNVNRMSIEGSCIIESTVKNDDLLSPNENDVEIICSSPTKLFSPNKLLISPLKQTTKILVPKPSPRLTDAGRRISFQGSDSEDEAKRKNFNLKEKSDAPNMAKTKNENLKEENPLKNTKRKRSQGPTFLKLKQDTMKEVSKKLGVSKDGALDKTKMTMWDLIFYNPKSNPMSVKPTQTAVRKTKEKIEVSQAREEELEEQSVDDIKTSEEAMPVPQLKVGPDGQVMLDPQSLVIESTDVQKTREKMENSEVVQDCGITRYSTYSKRKHRRCIWTPNDTMQFYKALSSIGSDFTLMATLFPNRTRHDLKLKFKREEKVNMKLVDKAMKLGSEFNFKTLQQEFEKENEEIERMKLEKCTMKAAKKERLATAKARPRRIVNKRIKIGSSAFKEFSDAELDMLYKAPKKQKLITIKKPKPKFDSDSEVDDLFLSDDNDDESIVSSLSANTHEDKRHTKKLKECEEINETLKKKLNLKRESKIDADVVHQVINKFDHETEFEEDVYTPNSEAAYMLYGSPLRENPTEAEEDRDWNIEIQKLPNIEDTVMLENVEEVSEISDLGSFGQNDTALDLSTPVRPTLTNNILRGREIRDPLLDRNLISESIQIIDQLTSSSSNGFIEENKPREHESEDLTDTLTGVSLADSHIRLPCFESVNPSRSSMVYSFQDPYDLSKYETHTSEVENETHNQEPHSNTALSNVFIANFYKETEESILGN